MAFPESPPASAGFSISLNTPSAADGTYSLRMTPAADSSILRGVLNSLPGGDFTLTVGVAGYWGVNYLGAGILFRDSAGKYIFFGPMCVSGRVLNQQNWSDHTTFAAEGAIALGSSDYPRFVRAVFTASSSDVQFSYSYSGDNFVDVGAAVTYLGTADAFGIGVSITNGSVPPLAFFTHYAVA